MKMFSITKFCTILLAVLAFDAFTANVEATDITNYAKSSKHKHRIVTLEYVTPVFADCEDQFEVYFVQFNEDQTVKSTTPKFLKGAHKSLKATLKLKNSESVLVVAQSLTRDFKDIDVNDSGVLKLRYGPYPDIIPLVEYSSDTVYQFFNIDVDHD